MNVRRFSVETFQLYSPRLFQLCFIRHGGCLLLDLSLFLFLYETLPFLFLYETFPFCFFTKLFPFCFFTKLFRTNLQSISRNFLSDFFEDVKSLYCSERKQLYLRLWRSSDCCWNLSWGSQPPWCPVRPSAPNVQQNLLRNDF